MPTGSVPPTSPPPTSPPPTSPPPTSPPPTSQGLFFDDFETGNTTNWDSSYSIFQATSSGGIANNSLRLNHVAGNSNSGSVEKGFADNAVSGYRDLAGPRANLATVEAKIKFSTNAFASDGSTKILILESWPGSSYPSTAEKDFQAVAEVDSNGRLVVTIKREDFDFYTRYPVNAVNIAANRTYKMKMQVQLDQPYTSANGILKLWVDDVLLIDRNNEDFILASRGSDLPKGLNMLMITGYTGGSGSPDAKSQYWDDVMLDVGVGGFISPPNPPVPF
jgi:hypothetical protein